MMVKRLTAIVLFFLLAFGIALSINGSGPGDGIPDGPDDDAGYGAPNDSCNGNGPGYGKLDSNEDEIVFAELS
jgi:hypothetical protein